MPARTRSLAAPLAVLLTTLAAAVPAPALAAKRSCMRGGATLEAASGGVRIVRDRAERPPAQGLRRDNLLACWKRTGKRVRVAQPVVDGSGNLAGTTVEIVEGRYVGVREQIEGGVGERISARVYDARGSKLLHTSAICDAVDQGHFSGVSDVVFLNGGGMAMTCRQLLLLRKAGSQLETLEAPGTDVRQLGLSKHTRGFGQRLFWTVISGDGELTKSIVL